MEYLKEEYWIDIQGVPGYQISNKNRYRSINRVVTSIKGVKIRRKGQILKKTYTTKGYVAIDIRPNIYKTHRLYAIHFMDNPHQLKIVEHIDGNSLNDDPSNLMWSTQSANIAFAYSSGTKIPWQQR